MELLNRENLEKHAKKLFGGATITVELNKDTLRPNWDITIIPYIDKGIRFIRLDVTAGMPGALAYLKKVQENILKLNHNGVFGINPISEKIDEKKIEEVINEKLPKIPKETYVCPDCMKVFKYLGRLNVHRKKHMKAPQSTATAINDRDIYDVK